MAARRSPHQLARCLITIEFAASGPGSSAPPAAAFRICTVVALGLEDSALALSREQTLGDTPTPPPPPALSKKTWVLEFPGARAEGSAGTLSFWA